VPRCLTFAPALRVRHLSRRRYDSGFPKRLGSGKVMHADCSAARWPAGGDLSDHRPAHVHVVGAGGEAVFILNCPEGPPDLREVYGFGFQEIVRIGNELTAHLVALCRHWSEIHGRF
jgi:hypothetical protein